MPKLLKRSQEGIEGSCQGFAADAAPMYVLCDSSPQGGAKSRRDYFLADLHYVVVPGNSPGNPSLLQLPRLHACVVRLVQATLEKSPRSREALEECAAMSQHHSQPMPPSSGRKTCSSRQ